MTIISKYFRSQKIERIRFLLRPERTRGRGCIYMFVKFLVALIAISIPLHIATPIFLYLEDALAADMYFYASGMVALFFLPVVLFMPIFAIDRLEQIWRRKENPAMDDRKIDLENLLRELQKTILKKPYNRQEIDYIFKQTDPERPLAQQLETLTGRQLTLIEDAILYTHEVTLTASGFSYGLKLMVFFVIVLTLLGFGTLYGLIEPYLRSVFGNSQAGFMMLYLFFPIAVFVFYRAQKDVISIWESLGASFRVFIRLSLYYWPVTLIIFALLNVIAKLWGAI